MVLSNEAPDSGFDLMCIKSQTIPNKSYGNKVLLGVKCAMTAYNTAEYTPVGKFNCGYYLYPRSSTGTKTTLRLANSVGIIDAGYRGEICAVFDNTADEPVEVQQDQRLVQICRGDLGPFLVEIVSSESKLGSTHRGTGGFGSTGK
jgi:dUTP pyrophosphatase